MRLKRVAALILAAPLLQLNIVRAEIACTAHDRVGDSAASEVQQHDGAGHDGAGHHAHGPDAPSSAPSSSDAPARSNCCQALASCSLVLGFDGIDGTEQPGIGGNLVVVALAEIPLSRRAAPDPPPPKV